MSISFFFDKEELKSLISLVEAGHVKVYITDITDEEIRKKIRDVIKGGFDKITHSDARVLKAIPEFRGLLDNYDIDKTIELLTKRYELFKEECKISMISSVSTKVLDIYKHYAHQQPPFGPAFKKNEFPDAFALHTILNWVRGNDSKAYILSGDNDWKEFANQARRGWAMHDRLLHYLNEISEFTNNVYKVEDDLKDLASFGDKLVAKKKEEIEKQVATFTMNSDFETAEYDYYILEVHRLEIHLVGKEIIHIERDASVYNMEFELVFLVRVTIADFNSSQYNLDEYLATLVDQDSFYNKSTIKVKAEVSISHDEGLESNFAVTDVQYPSTITVPAKWDDIISVEEWATKQEVIIFGVEDGKMTEDGDGRTEFKSFEDAKTVFPTLALMKDSEDFFYDRDAGLFAWIHGPLQYFTHQAIEHLYG